jgi:aspartyl/asparaginyl beta-hydroxylase (cupin superfamily)
VAAFYRTRTAIRQKWEYGLTKGLNKMYAWAANGDQRPAFYDIDKTYPSLRILDQNHAVIGEELAGILANHSAIPRYHDIVASETYISGTFNPDRDWKVFMLNSFAGTPARNQAKCPRTTELINRIPNIYQAFFSILDPGKSIPAHNGVYLGYLRYHLGLIVPKNNPPRMRVRDQWHTWKERESILFDDSLNHEVENHSDSIRVVLIVDVLRPMPLPLHALNWTITQVLYRKSEEAKKFMKVVDRYS